MSYPLKLQPAWATFVVACLLSAHQGAHAQQPDLLALQHLRGVLERLDQQQGTVVVSGETYELSRSVKVLDRDERVQPLAAARQGSKVLLVVGGTAVSSAMLDPGPSEFLEGLSR